MTLCPTKARGITTLGLALALSFGCSRQAPQPSQSTLPFEFTNVVIDASAFRKDPAAETIINFTNNVWFGHQSEEISMGLGPADFDVSVFFNRTNRSVRRIVQSKRPGAQTTS